MSRLTSLSVAIHWDNFGPMHHDRMAACARHMPANAFTGIELSDTSATYAWKAENQTGYTFVTLFSGAKVARVPFYTKAFALVRACRKARARTVFLCNYELPYVFTAAVILRILGHRVAVMQNSKFNDSPRHWLKELLKVILYAPYQAALTGSPSSRDYLKLLGFKKRPIILGYNTLSVQRIQNLAAGAKSPAFNSRPFIIIARLVPKKNLHMALHAFALYAQSTPKPRPLHIYGNGPLDNELKQLAHNLKIDKLVKFHGFAQTEDIAPALAASLALVLPSTEEQFGNVIIEAQALGIPVLVSNVCGACDELVRNGTNGFTFSPDDAPGLAYWMHHIGTDPTLWKKLSQQAPHFAALGDVSRFAQSMQTATAFLARPQQAKSFCKD